MTEALTFDRVYLAFSQLSFLKRVFKQNITSSVSSFTRDEKVLVLDSDGSAWYDGIIVSETALTVKVNMIWGQQTVEVPIRMVRKNE